MRIGRFIALLGTFLGALACATVHVWTFTAGWDVERAQIAMSVISVAWFAFIIPVASRDRRLGIEPPSTSRPQPSLLMALVPHVLLYAVLTFAVYFAMVGSGGVAARNGHYFQNTPNWGARLRKGRAINTEWEIPLAKYKRIRGFELRGWSAFIFWFHFFSFAVFALPDGKKAGTQLGPV
jgi:hypothetical protein